MMKNKSALKGIGIDLAKISRFEGQSSLAKKILSPKEYQVYSTHHQPARYLAGRFAAKEAFIKAYHKSPLPDLNSIEVLHEGDGAPFILFKKKTYLVSISHDGEYAIALVIM